jgi:hypothetical protein
VAADGSRNKFSHPPTATRAGTRVTQKNPRPQGPAGRAEAPGPRSGHAPTSSRVRRTAARYVPAPGAASPETWPRPATPGWRPPATAAAPALGSLRAVDRPPRSVPPKKLPNTALAPAWATPARGRSAQRPVQRSLLGAARPLADSAPTVSPVGAGGATRQAFARPGKVLLAAHRTDAVGKLTGVKTGSRAHVARRHAPSTDQPPTVILRDLDFGFSIFQASILAEIRRGS